MSKTIGVIAEDVSDVEIVRILARRLYTRPLGFRHNVGDGCGRIQSKCLAWAIDLKRRGCSHLIVIRDADKHNANELEQVLRAELRAAPITSKVVVIPTIEIEAWLLADERAIKSVFNLKKTPPLIGNPETIDDPKKRLDAIVRSKSGGARIYLNTIHNKSLAEHARMTSLRRCASFAPFENFLLAL